MRFLHVQFGNKSSPFLLNATIKHHWNTFQETPVILELQENVYVDDWLSGADFEKEACDLFFEAKGIMAKASMPLAKWTSNSQVVSDKIYQEISAKHLIPGESIKVLGTKWIAKNYTFTFDGVEVPNDIILTKCIVFRFIAQLLDPLGLLNPFIMQIKFLFQEIWCLGLEWDDKLPEEYQNKFLTWVERLNY